MVLEVTHRHAGETVDPFEVEVMAMELMAEWLPPYWTFEWSRSRTILGQCVREPYPNGDGMRFLIVLSKPLTIANDANEMRDTILHEIAHALTDEHAPHHGKEWKRNAERVGARPETSSRTGRPAPYKWEVICPHCGPVHRAYRLAPYWRNLVKNGQGVCVRCDLNEGVERTLTLKQLR